MKVELPLAGAGKHQMEFLGNSEEDGRFGRKSYRWRFSDGKCVASVVTGTYLAPGTQCYTVACSVLGRKLETGEDVDLNEMVGEKFAITVKTDGGIVVKRAEKAAA